MLIALLGESEMRLSDEIIETILDKVVLNILESKIVRVTYTGIKTYRELCCDDRHFRMLMQIRMGK